MLVVVDAPHFYAGIIFGESGRVVRAAPILAWAIGKDAPYLAAYFRRKGWKATTK